MSTKSMISDAVSKAVTDYIEEISKTFDLDKKQLVDMWSANTSKLVEPIATVQCDMNLAKCTASVLKEMCKEKGVRCTGTKAELICYLSNIPVPEKPKRVKKPKSPSDVKITKAVEAKKDTIIKKIVQNIPTISIHKNQYGNFEHAETSFVFNKQKKVIGKQNGKIVEDLSSEDINLCNKFKFSYILPDNLDKKTSSVDDSMLELDLGDQPEAETSDDVEVEVEVEVDDDDVELLDDDFEDDFEEEYEDVYEE